MIKRLLVILFLIAVSTGAAPDDRLDSWYAGFNHAFFQDELPKTVIITKTLTDDDFMAQTFYENGRYHIVLNPKYNISTKVERMNLLHESCHIEIFIEGEEEFDDHGSHWQHCMHHLADQKAFDNLW